MQLQSFLVSTFALLAAAQTATIPSSTRASASRTTAPAPTATSTGSLVSLVQGLPPCGVKCLADAAGQANCGATDLKCLCANAGALQNNLSLLLCVSNNCNSDETAKLLSDVPQVCSKVNNNPSPAEVSSASSIVASALGTAGVPTSTSRGAAPRRTDAPALAIMGGAAAAIAAYAL